jgi:hypothetical protein
MTVATSSFSITTSLPPLFSPSQEFAQRLDARPLQEGIKPHVAPHARCEIFPVLPAKRAYKGVTALSPDAAVLVSATII